MKKPQWLTIAAAIFLIAVIYFFGQTAPSRSAAAQIDDHAHNATGSDLTDTILNMAKRQITPEQVIRITTLENSISRGAVRAQQLDIYHQLAHFWGDSIGLFLPYAWYEAEAARLENSEKTLTFAARLFLENLQREENPGFRKWEAMQAKDLFERSLKINPANDSASVGLGAVYLFGNISDAPMEGITRIRTVLDKDSTNVYAQMMLVKGSLMSGQYDKAINRLQTIHRLEPSNFEAMLMMADGYEKLKDKPNAVKWYRQSLPFIKRQDMRAAIENRIEELGK
ncbi:MAG: hypothetical protein H7Y42_11920 [Chitinophagaceae bacterium]|nr:hypothetical protein [Chitinophagaceae bacterium]